MSLVEIGRNQLVEAFTPVATHRPAVGVTAAVAAVFRRQESGATHGGGGTELLFIERAARDGDPWSGHMAFPGGRCEPGDADLEATAERETYEELALDLTGTHRLGRLDPIEGNPAGRRALSVTAHGYWWDGERPALVPNDEVAAALWVGLEVLADPARWIDYHYPVRPELTYPGILLEDGERVVWGMTLRFLRDLFARIDVPFL